MITIQLLGGAKKAVGQSCVSLDRSSASIAEILKLLKDRAVQPKILDPSNILVTLNGADSAMLRGDDTTVKTGDIVTIVTIVHGGNDNKL